MQVVHSQCNKSLETSFACAGERGADHIGSFGFEPFLIVPVATPEIVCGAVIAGFECSPAVVSKHIAVFGRIIDSRTSGAHHIGRDLGSGDHIHCCIDILYR